MASAADIRARLREAESAAAVSAVRIDDASATSEQPNDVRAAYAAKDAADQRVVQLRAELDAALAEEENNKKPQARGGAIRRAGRMAVAAVSFDFASRRLFSRRRAPVLSGRRARITLATAPVFVPRAGTVRGQSAAGNMPRHLRPVAINQAGQPISYSSPAAFPSVPLTRTARSTQRGRYVGLSPAPSQARRRPQVAQIATLRLG